MKAWLLWATVWGAALTGAYYLAFELAQRYEPFGR